MHLIIYTSESTIASSVIDEELIKISKQAKMNNKQLDINGLLFFHHGLFIQVLEGEKQNLEQLMVRLELDNRHRNIDRIIDEPIESPSFFDWNMDAFNLDSKEKIDQAALTMFINVYKLNYALKTDKLINMYKAMVEHQEDLF